MSENERADRRQSSKSANDTPRLRLRVSLVPSATETTAITFQFNPPDACAPQSVLLAVPPVPDAPWTVGGLHRVLMETLDMAKLRAVDCEALGELGPYMPALYFAFNLAVGLYYARRAQGSVSEFFLSGRDAPWWLAGTSMVATTFAADTPLVVTGLVASNGIAGNWLWWNLVMSGMLTVFLYARLWRRAGVMTDIEFAELRYSGKPAAFLRGFRALYLGLPINCIILGWVNLAMVKILEITLNLDKRGALKVVIGMLIFHARVKTLGSSMVASYEMTSGLDRV